MECWISVAYRLKYQEKMGLTDFAPKEHKKNSEIRGTTSEDSGLECEDSSKASKINNWTPGTLLCLESHMTLWPLSIRTLLLENYHRGYRLKKSNSIENNINMQILTGLGRKCTHFIVGIYPFLLT